MKKKKQQHELMDNYKRFFGKTSLNESEELVVALDAAAESGYNAIMKVINVDYGEVEGRDREGSGTVDLAGQSIDWELETYDGGTTITIGDENLEELDAYSIYQAILDKFNDEGYEMVEDEEDEDY